MNMKDMKRISLFLLLIIRLLPIGAQVPSLKQEESREDIFAPFASRFKAEAKGSSILLSWHDARNLEDSQYHIYFSEEPIDSEDFDRATLLTTVPSGKEQYVYEPEDGKERYFLILAEEEQLYDVFIPYRNMTMSPTAAILHVVEEEKATLLSDLKVFPDLQNMTVSGKSSRPERQVILFRSTEILNDPGDLEKAARVTTLTGENLQWKDQVVPGIPFYYALIDLDLYESGSDSVLYEGSVTLEPVIIELNEWSPREAHIFQFSSRHIPLPMLNIRRDIENGNALPGPALSESPIELNADTALKLAELNFGKSRHSANWMEAEILPVDTGDSINPAIQGIPLLLENQDWDSAISRIDRELQNAYEIEIKARLHYYKAQSLYFRGDLENAFMNFLSSRELYYSESDVWIYNIFKLKQMKTRMERVEF